jgi:hypothetical protein
MPKKKERKGKFAQSLHPVMVDLAVYKTIEGARQSFKESQNTILRRLLGVEACREASAMKGAADNQTAHSEESAVEGGLALPDGSELRADFRGVSVHGAVRGGTWQVEGSDFNLPAAALLATLQGSTEPPPELDGWSRWQVRLPGVDGWQSFVEAEEKSAA